MIAYPAIFKEDKSAGGYTVEFPDLPGCISEGDTFEEAHQYSKDALSLYLESIDLRKLPIPKPSIRKGKNIYYIEPEMKVAFAIWLKLNREEKHFSQQHIAKKLGISQQAYQKYENPKKTNPPFSNLLKLEKIFEKNIFVPIFSNTPYKHEAISYSSLYSSSLKKLEPKEKVSSKRKK